MQKNNDFQQALDLINKSENLLITTHTKPDGDAIGCMVAMAEALTAIDKKVTPLLLSALPQWYQFLLTEEIPIFDEDVKAEDLSKEQFDLILIVDTNSPIQLPKFSEYLKKTEIPILVIDHHSSSDGLKALEVVDSSAAATGLIVLELFKYAGWNITEKIAEALFVAAATDTGWFRFNNTDGRVFSSCAELIAAGANSSGIYSQLYENSSPQRFMLMVAMLNTLELHINGRFSVMQITQQDFKNTGANYGETENMINEARRIKSVDSSALLIELKDGQIRCSLRSKGTVDVGEIAGKFGGGGHKMAAGTFIDGPMDKAKKAIISEFEKVL